MAGVTECNRRGPLHPNCLDMVKGGFSTTFTDREAEAEEQKGSGFSFLPFQSIKQTGFNHEAIEC